MSRPAFPVAAFAICTPPAETEGACVEVTIEPAPTGEYIGSVGGHHAAADTPEIALCRALTEGGFRGWKPVAIAATFEDGGQVVGGSGWVVIVSASGQIVPLSPEEKAAFAESDFLSAFELAAEILTRASK